MYNKSAKDKVLNMYKQFHFQVLLGAERIPRPFVAGMNGGIIMWASGARSHPTKFSPLPRLIPCRGLSVSTRRSVLRGNSLERG